MIGSAVVGAVTAVYGAYQQYQAGQSAADAASYNAQVEKENEQIALERAKTNVMEQERADRYATGAQAAAYGGSGVAMTGSPMDEMAAKAIDDRFKVQVAYFNGLVNMQQDQAASNIDQMMASQYSSAGTANAVAGIGQAAGDIYQAYAASNKGGSS